VSPEDKLAELTAYRLEQARDALAEGRLLHEAGHFRGAVNRAYYAMFYAAQALLVRDGHQASKHAGMISLFDREFVKKGLFDQRFSKWLHALFDLRQDADYGDMSKTSSEQSREAVDRAMAFVAEVASFLSSRGSVVHGTTPGSAG
jgi:uncharacterized protein (UPF0332 family)